MHNWVEVIAKSYQIKRNTNKPALKCQLHSDIANIYDAVFLIRHVETFH